ncbi:Tex family protein [endosymbiont of unidentified scaly snail isolate Monju]|uniref:Tex family protein n=1 Tax=endosymbiont of unidentified scaly snail isolate Monju TaxID=1248727 RepID=UPI0003891DDA|nr:Tex family protein [endosymbiont of unidentified scaly snail isolate Monju]BAN69843.1 RNA-binding S1 domain-containing protein [endosymbiont of unidentified scaly snail isolate Monju]
MLPPISHRIAADLAARPAQVEAAIALIDQGATVPFIARYRKEVTGGLDDGQLRLLEERLGYLRELEARRETVLRTIDEQGKLTPALRADILAAETRTALEDLYLPYKPKRRTRAQIAREAGPGLAPLAERLLEDPEQSPEAAAEAFIDAEAGFADVQAVLDGARQILMEDWAEDAQLVGEVRDWLWDNAELTSRVIEGKEREGAKFSDYFEFAQPIRAIPSHRALALFRARNEGIVQLDLRIDEAEDGSTHPERLIARRFGVSDRGRPADAWLRGCVRFAWRVKLLTRLDLELKNRLREAAETEAIRVFASNLKDLLLAAPAGPRPTLGLDPGLRTGVKVAVVDGTGKVVATDTLYPHPPQKQWDQALSRLAELARRHDVELIAIGNGTASRETDRLAGELIARYPELGLHKVLVSEAGASELAARELPELDVSLRGAVSIARRLQDPLAELVKIDPKAIGVGQYQHDVSQVQLARALDNVVEDCVNAVGVDVNTASAALLRRVAGLNETVAANIVAHRDAHGAFRNRRQLLEVSRLGEKTFEQAAGFLRIRDGDDPLDASAVHPEAYPVVQRIMAQTGLAIGALIGNRQVLSGLDPAAFTDERFGEPTVRDILAELEKPGRDPRPEFRTARFAEGVERLEDLKPGMVLEGVVSNVTNFGAFVDIGVHQDGLVHISAMSDRFVKDPRQVVRAGEVVKVKVMSVDVERRRIGLSMRLSDEPGREEDRAPRGERKVPRRVRKPREPQAPASALAEAFARARQKR